ncbi:MAG: hypothetical protein Q8L80_00895, partial [Gallionella sp.]|nr:hypothetical protein [Gallionella sp.]
CVVFISGVDQVFRTLILPAMAAHFYLFFALQLAINSAQIRSFARASTIETYFTNTPTSREKTT